MRPFVLLSVVAVLAVAGCGGDDEPPRSQLAERLGQLCDDTRQAVEELGDPIDKGAAMFRPWSRVGLRFVDDVRRLPTTTERERKQVTSMAGYFTGFFDSLALGYVQYLANQSEMTKMTLRRGYAQLASAEKLATQLGAPECAERPFATVSL